MSSIRAFSARVAAVQQLSPTYRRITVAGPALAHFGEAGPLHSRDLRIKLMLGADGSSDRIPDEFRDGELPAGWYQRWLALAPEVRGVMRTYTVRSIRGDGEHRQLDIDFVLHTDADGHSGPASSWAQAARVGDSVTLLGPTALENYGGITWNPPAAVGGREVSVLLAGDETAVPAVCSIVESLPAGVRGHAVLEVPRPEDVVPVGTASAVRVTWLARGTRPHGEQLVQQVRALLGAPSVPGTQTSVAEAPDPDELLWEVPPPSAASTLGLNRYTWVAGETAMVRELRRVVAAQPEPPSERRQTAFMGYWRHGRAEGS